MITRMTANSIDDFSVLLRDQSKLTEAESFFRAALKDIDSVG
jgi:Tfp pilus assembly protein PilX